MPAFFEIFMAIIGAMMNNASILAQDSANNQNIALARETLNKQQKFSEESAEQAYQRQIDMYTRFFSPEAMTQQYKQAGLNPALIYAKGGVGGSSSAAPMAATPTATVPYINPIIGQGQMAEMMNVVKTLTEAQKTKSETEMNYTKIDQIQQEITESQKRVEEIESKIGVNLATKESIQLDVEIKKIQKQFDQDTYFDKWKSIKTQNEIYEKTAKKLEKEIYGLDIENKYKDEYWEATNANLKAQKTLMNAQEGVALAQKLLIDKQAEHEGKKIELTSLEIRKLAKIVDEYEKFGYKATEANNWATELMSVLREIFARLFGENETESEVMESASGKGIYYQGKLYYPAENK